MSTVLDERFVTRQPSAPEASKEDPSNTRRTPTLRERVFQAALGIPSDRVFGIVDRVFELALSLRQKQDQRELVDDVIRREIGCIETRTSIPEKCASSDLKIAIQTTRGQGYYRAKARRNSSEIGYSPGHFHEESIIWFDGEAGQWRGGTREGDFVGLSSRLFDQDGREITLEEAKSRYLTPRDVQIEVLEQDENDLEGNSSSRLLLYKGKPLAYVRAIERRGQTKTVRELRGEIGDEINGGSGSSTLLPSLREFSFKGELPEEILEARMEEIVEMSRYVILEEQVEGIALDILAGLSQKCQLDEAQSRRLKRGIMRFVKLSVHASLMSLPVDINEARKQAGQPEARLSINFITKPLKAALDNLEIPYREIVGATPTPEAHRDSRLGGQLGYYATENPIMIYSTAREGMRALQKLIRMGNSRTARAMLRKQVNYFGDK